MLLKLKGQLCMWTLAEKFNKPSVHVELSARYLLKAKANK